MKPALTARHHLDLARVLLRKHEGRRLKPYRCTSGALTIGYGRNLDAKGISPEEAEVLLAHDLADSVADAQAWIGPAVWEDLSEVRKAVLVDMAFNLGAERLAGFAQTRAAILAGDWADAADAMLESRWARQVGKRADRLAGMMETGAAP